MREREREGGERETNRERERERVTWCFTPSQPFRLHQGERGRQTETNRQPAKDRERETDRQTDRQTEIVVRELLVRWSAGVK